MCMQYRPTALWLQFKNGRKFALDREISKILRIPIAAYGMVWHGMVGMV